MISKKSLYYFVLQSVISVPAIIAAQLGYHIWNKGELLANFNFAKSYFVATIISLKSIFVSNIFFYKEKHINAVKDISQ